MQSVQSNRETKFVVAGAVVNVMLLVMKIVVAVFAHSMALMADAIHSLFNILADGLSVIFGVLNRKPKDDAHDYGYGRYATVICLGMSVLLFVLAFLWGFRCVEGLVRYMQGTGVFQNTHWMAVLAALVSVLVLWALSRFALQHARQLNDDLLADGAQRYDFDMWSSLGTFVALIPVTLLAGKWKMLDSLTALVICLFVMYEACKMFRSALDELLDKSLPAQTEADLAQLAAMTDGVEKVTGVLTRRVGGRMAVELNVTMPADDSLLTVDGKVNDIKRRIEGKYTNITYLAIHVEPTE